MKTGWICSYRTIWDHPFFKGKGMRVAVWHWLLHHAAWKQTRHRSGAVWLTVERGEVCFSQQQIQDDTGASRKQVRDVIDWLLEHEKASKIGANGRANEPAKLGANPKTLLRIDKYDEYQLHENKGPTEGPTEGPTKEQGITNIKTLEPKGSLSAKADDKAVISEAVKAYREMAERQEWPNIRILSKARKSALRARLRDLGGIDGWHDALAKAAASSHCNGSNDRGWVCNFDFLTRQSSLAKLMEGNYDDRNDQSHNRSNTGRSGPHDSLFAGFAAFANRDDDAGGGGFGGGETAFCSGHEAVDCGPGGYASRPVLRVIGSE